MTTDKRLVETVDTTLAAAVQSLLDSRGQQSHWNDVRATAAAIWALEEVMRGRNSPENRFSRLKRATTDAATWLAGQARREEGGISWESEAWDTSFAIFALLAAGTYDETVDRATAWLDTIRCRRSGVWYDEVWETTLTTIAILRRQAFRKGPKQECDNLVLDVIRWLTDIPSKSSGEFINPHYSAFLVWLDAEIRNAHITARTLLTQEYVSFRSKVEASARWLVGNALANPDDLWCPYTFANAYAAFALACHPDFCRRDAAFLMPVVQWFYNHRGNAGGFEDTEDTALAAIALSRMRNFLDTPGDTLERALSAICSESSRGDIPCFLGYAGRADDVALRLKDYLRNDIPALRLIDWKWDFKIGRTLSEEIESRSSECRIAIFLLTKDDLVATSGPPRHSPRDNVIFEVGVFFGTVGRSRTILVVEAGAELPSDWAGLLHIEFTNRKDLSSAQVPLRRAIDAALATE